MNPTNGMNNPLATGALGGIATALVPTINWALGGFHGPVPDTTASLIAIGLVSGAHFALNWFKTRNAAKSPVAPAQS